MTAMPDAFVTALSDRYRLERELGAGGMATVWLAQDLKHQRQVAVKVLREDLTASLGKERFLREITIAAGLTHPHILPLHDSGEAAGRLFYVMPYVDGPSLRQKLLRGGELPIADAVRILRDVADAMAHAHKRGVVHRDLKPENVMLTERHALVTDFGVAKALSEATGRQTLTTAGVALGTPAYMSPEQATADPNADHRSDIYAFGVLAYELLTGRPPFQGSSPQEVLAAHVTTAAVPVTQHRASIPPALAALVMRCLEKKPADRPQGAEELIPVLEALLTPSGATPPAQRAASHPADDTRVRFGPHVRLVTGAAIAVMAALLGVYLLMPRRPNPSVGAREPVLVLPFDVDEGDAIQSQLGLRIAEDIAAAIESNNLALVVRRDNEAAEAFSARVARRAVRETGAATLVVGAVTERDGQVEASARIVRSSDLRTIWTLGPVRAPAGATASAIDGIRDRILGAVGWYLSPSTPGSNAALYQPPPSLSVFRLVQDAEELIRSGRALEAIPIYRDVITRDSGYAFKAMLRLTDLPIGREENDSLLAFLQTRRDRLAPGDALVLDANRATHGSPEAYHRAILALAALDTMEVTSAVGTALAAGRPAEALRWYARRDTTAGWEQWQGLHEAAGMAYHMLGQYEAERRLAQEWQRRAPGAFAHWKREVSALAAQGAIGALDSVITASHGLEHASASTRLAFIASVELRNHDHADAARPYAERVIAAVERWPDSLRRDPSNAEMLRQALSVVGRHAEAWTLYAAEARSAGDGGLGWRLLGARERILMGDTTGVRALVDSARTAPLSAFAGSGWEWRGTPLYHGAALLALLERKEEVVDMLRDALNNGARLEPDEALLPHWRAIRDSRAFKEIVQPREGR